MKNSNRLVSITATLLSLLLSVIGWMIFAPTQLGGSVTYVMVDGNSMEPGFHLGDLLLIRTQTSYQIGDAVTYQNAELGRYVFHRIIGTELNRYVLKGDNNSWLDSYHPDQSEIVGKLWVHIPKLGNAIEWVRLPFNWAVAMGLLGGVFMLTMIKKQPQRGKEKNKPSQKSGGIGIKQGALYITGFLTLIFLGLSIFSFTRPLTSTIGNIPYQQEGQFFYSATGTPGVYDTELVRSGEPVFPKLTCFLNIGFTYNLLADQLQEASGTNQLYARVLDSQSGWQRTIPLNPQTTFIGNTYSTLATLDLCQVESLANLVEQETGLHPNTYTLEIVSHVELTGNIAGNQVSDTFDPSLVFAFDKVHFYLDIKDAKTDPLRMVKQGLAGSSDLQANTIQIVGLNPTVKSIRLISLLGLGFSLIGLVIAGTYVYRTAWQSEEALIRLKYGAILVDIQEQSLKPASSVIDVTKIDDLARLAERHGTMILHKQLNSLHTYLVQSNEMNYRYVVGTSEDRVAEVAPPYDEITEHLVQPEEEQFVTDVSLDTKLPEYFIENNEDGIANTQPVLNRIIEPHVKNDENITSKFEPLQDETSENDKDKLIEAEMIRREALAQLINSYKNLEVNEKPVSKESVEYVIDTGAIGFVMPEFEETKILRKIKL
ncbi:MAG: signal peptidase I [Anaerolineales bacterium]|nr:signal peptidase I [Anaerolineales bacterium]